MAAIHDYSAPSVQERITALHDHRQLYDTIAQHPQAGVHERFMPEWALAIAYIEGEVHRCRRAAELFIHENAQPGRGLMGGRRKIKGLTRVMNPLIKGLFLHTRAIKAVRVMALSPSPAPLFMNENRINSGVEQGIMRAANGELLSIYGQVGDPIPSNLGAIDRKDLEPLEEFIAYRLMDPFIKYIGQPFRSLWFNLPMYRNTGSPTDIEVKEVNGRIISAIARAVVCVIAILSLAAPIATLNIIEGTELRIVVMTLFGQLFAALAQFMGHRSIPYYTLITAYYQVMVIFLGTTSGNKTCN